jgi:hypothetical protein
LRRVEFGRVAFTSAGVLAGRDGSEIVYIEENARLVARQSDPSNERRLAAVIISLSSNEE